MGAKSPLLACAVAAVAALLGSGVAQAQRYETIPAKISDRAAKQLVGDVTAVLRGNSLTDDGKKKLDEYFKSYYFPTMTHYKDPEKLAEVADMREQFFSRYVNRTNSAEVRNYLIDMARTAMGGIAVRNFHPAVRYNAVLLIASMDKEPAGTGRNAKPPVPLPAATNILLLLLEKEEISGNKIPEPVKAGALVGLERHARFGIDPAMAERLTKATIAIVQQSELKAGMERGIQDWMRCMAASVLATQYKGGPTQPVLDALTALIADKKMSLNDRCRVARMLSDMKFEGVANLDVSATTLALAELSSDVFNKEAKLARDFQKKLLGDAPGGGGRGYGGGGYGGGEYRSRSRGMEFSGRGGGGYGGMGQDDGAHYQARRLLARLTALRAGIKQLETASPEAEEKLQTLYQPINLLIDSAVDKDSDEISTSKSVIATAKEISLAVQALRPEEPEEPAEDELPADPADVEGEPAEAKPAAAPAAEAAEAETEKPAEPVAAE